MYIIEDKNIYNIIKKVSDNNKMFRQLNLQWYNIIIYFLWLLYMDIIIVAMIIYSLTNTNKNKTLNKSILHTQQSGGGVNLKYKMDEIIDKIIKQ